MPSSKKAARLAQKAAAGVRSPRPPSQLTEESPKRGYRVVAVSLYTPEADWLDHITRALQQAGNPKANRSLVVREAILRLRSTLEGMEPAEILLDFVRHQAHRR
jgi:hypothetical protein